MLQAIQPTDLVQHMTQSPAEGWSCPYERINPSYYDLLRQATITAIFSRQSKNPKVQLLHQNPVTLLPQGPWLQNAAASFTEGTRLKGAAFSEWAVSFDHLCFQVRA